MESVIRKATENDLDIINDIYNYYVLKATCTFQTEIETMQERRKWFQEHGDEYPIIVCGIGREIMGWASLSPFHTRQAYKPTVENSVYVRNDQLRKGIGSSLLMEIIGRAGSIGYHSIIAKIAGDQPASIIIHEKFGFRKVAHLKEVGFKFNKWLDVVYYQLIISHQ